MNDKLKEIEGLLDAYETHAVDLGHLGPGFAFEKVQKARDALRAAIADLAPKGVPVSMNTIQMHPWPPSAAPANTLPPILLTNFGLVVRSHTNDWWIMVDADGHAVMDEYGETISTEKYGTPTWWAHLPVAINKVNKEQE
jgi:hypothetical protein